MPSIAKLGHVALVTPDMDRSLWFWSEVIGLEEVQRTGEAVFLRGWGEFEHHSLSLREGPTSIDHIGWRAGAPEDVDAYAGRLAELGVDSERVEAGEEPGQGAAVRFRLPGGGHPFEIYYDVEKPLLPEERRSRLKNQTGRARGTGISPRCIDHVNLGCAEPGVAGQWLGSELGFKGREHVRFTTGEHVASWMAVTSLSHDIALVAYPPPRDDRFHHVAYYLDNWHDVLQGLDVLAEHAIGVDLGPGRHGISQAFFTYVKDPGSGHRLELFSGGYHVYDPDWESIEWSEADLKEGLVWWGPEYPLGECPAMDTTTPCTAEQEALA
jgi:biphenyl-2,3-diol 1,2-dioxygenase